MKKVKTCAVINDLTGYGRCALNVSVPVMSALGVRVLAAPTAVLSNHTGFDEYYFSDLTDGLSQYFENWERLKLQYDAIYTGFLGSERQVDIIARFIQKARDGKTRLFVDPVMGDEGRLYSTYTSELVLKMRSLVCHADIITPNLTEACLLADIKYEEMAESGTGSIRELAKRLSRLGARRVVITGICRGDRVYNVAYDGEDNASFVSSSQYIAGQFCGTGDLFSSLLFGYFLEGMPFKRSVEKTSRIVTRAVRLSVRLGADRVDGVAFEPLLKRI